jgi:ribosome-associated protein
LDIRKKQKAVIAALEDVKASNIEAFNVTHLSAEFDRVILATGESARQVKALARSVQEKMRELGEPVIGVEGEQQGEWVLVDLGDIIVHVMHPNARQYYNLEELWGQPKPRKAPARARTAAQTGANAASNAGSRTGF